MERKDAQPAKSGISEELSKEIDAQYAIIHSAQKLINQHRQAQKLKNNNGNWNNDNESNNNSIGGGIYNMKDLADWVHYYTERRRLYCPKCKADSTFTCQTCDEVYEFHDEL